MFSIYFNGRTIFLVVMVWLYTGFPLALLAKECDETIALALSVQGQVERLHADGAAWMPVHLNQIFCAGDLIRVGAKSRASLKLYNETLLRLSEYTSVRLAGPSMDGTTWLGLLKGIAHFISRVRHKFQVETSYINAGIEGTEFILSTRSDHSILTVLEGRVKANNIWGEVRLKGGQKAVAYSGKAPRIESVVDPLDAVQWTLYYPPLIENESLAGQKSIKAYRRGDLNKAFSALAQVNGIERNAPLLVYRAALQLRVGAVESAQHDLFRALELVPGTADALALLSIIDTVQGQRQRALDLAQRAVDADPLGLSPLLALSYAHQANFQLTEALEIARQAAVANPGRVLAWTQLARLHLMFYQLDEANEALKRAVTIAPNNPQARTLLGLIHLSRLDFENARRDFEQAIDLDSAASPLPRLGLGLLEIRQGHWVEGRRQLEIAANLDPGNAMIRSYLGKSYYEEKRDNQAATQFALAKQFDELDPTAWFYNAVLLRSQNRPNEALKEMQTAIDLNDNRAVYRSRNLLALDEAARIDSLGRIYADLGFVGLARDEAYKSLQISASNHSAHRLLADSLNGSLSTKSQASELLQSQLLQPLNRNSHQVHAGVHDGLLDSAGPAVGGMSEYAPFFTGGNGLNLRIDAQSGGHGSMFTDLILSGLHDRVAFSLNPSHYEDEGWRENSDDLLDNYNAFLQFAVVPETSMQMEYSNEKAEAGDRSLNFELDNYSKNLRSEREEKYYRIGLHHELASAGHVMFSAIDLDRTEKHSDSDQVKISDYRTPDGDFSALDVMSTVDIYDLQTRTLEVQLIQPFHDHTFILGGGRFTEDWVVTESTQWALNLLLPEPPYIAQYLSQTYPTRISYSDSQYENLYVYSLLALPARLRLTLGVTQEKLERISEIVVTEINPKFGLTWEAYENWTLRAAYMENMASPRFMYRTLEPTHVAGFNQFMSITGGTKTKGFGFGADTKINKSLFIGAGYQQHNHLEPTITTDSDAEGNVHYDVDYVGIDTESASASVDWAATKRLGIYFSYGLWKVSSLQLLPADQVTKTIEFAIHYHWPSGFYLFAGGEYIDQKLVEDNENKQSNFWNMNLAIGYRFPKRYGRVVMGIQNLFDEAFEVYGQQADAVPVPKRSVFARFTLNF
jgi:tetratricopeptide (TPR) repeat protein